jgi:hypothetical protein
MIGIITSLDHCAGYRSMRALSVYAIWCAAVAIVLFLGQHALAGDCSDLTLTPEDHAFYIYPIHHGRCPGNETAIRCHKYHWHWVCQRGDTLYWDRRMEAAAHAACGCPMPEGVAPSSPAVSGKPRPDLITSDGGDPIE